MVRVRFAPSPTGSLHLGGARTALFNFLFSKANGGRYVLRIEDTDRAREVPGSLQRLEGALRWLGISFDEGPSCGGSYGPYLQSERLDLYRAFGEKLAQERLQVLRSTGVATGYDRHCRRLSVQEVQKNLSSGTPYTLRLKVPETGSTVVTDVVYGSVSVANATVDDQILLKTDGFPTYHLANVVDDHCMEISHVLRGEEWLQSTAKHLLLYAALGWQPPSFAHLPLLLSQSGGKLSKRNCDLNVESYRVSADRVSIESVA